MFFFPIRNLVRFLLLISFSFSSLGLNANKVREYYLTVDKAELYISEGKYEMANKMYRKAFKKKIFFLTDVYNAWISSFYSSNKRLFKRYFKLLLKRGIDKEFLMNEKSLQKVKKSKLWGKYFKKKMEQYNSKSHQNIEFINEVKFLLSADQHVRKQCPNYRSNCIDEVKKVDSLNLMKLIKTYEKHNYSKEINGTTPKNSLLGYTIISHNISWNRYWIDSILINKVREGKIHAREAAFVLSKLGINPPIRKSYIFETPMIINGTIFFPKNIQTDAVEEKKTNREVIFLGGQKDYLKKMKFDIKNKDFMLYNPGYIPVIQGIPQEIIENKIKPIFDILHD